MAKIKYEAESVDSRFDRINIDHLFPQQMGVDVPREKWVRRWNIARALTRLVLTMGEEDLLGGAASCLDYVSRFQDQIDEYIAWRPSQKSEKKDEIDKELDKKFEYLILNLENLLIQKFDWDQRMKNDREVALNQRHGAELRLSEVNAAFAEKDGEIATLNRLVQNEVLEVDRLKEEIEETKKELVTQELRAAKGRFSENAIGAATSAKYAGQLAGATVLALVALTLWFYSHPVENASTNVFWSLSLLRFFVLAILSGLSFVLLQIARAYLQIREMNRHRMEIANSFEPIVGGASRENRDQILLLMVNALVDFGESGLVARTSNRNLSFPVSDMIKFLGSQASK